MRGSVVAVGAAAAVLLALLLAWLRQAPPQQEARRHDPQAPSEKGGQVCSRHAADPQWARLCGWLEDECGATRLDHVFLGEFERAGILVRGVGAARDVAEGEHVTCLPRKCWFVEGIESERLKTGLSSARSCNSLQMAALHLAEETRKGENSSWWPYLSMLPREEAYRRFHPAFLKETLAEAWSPKYWSRWTGQLKDCHRLYQAAFGDSAVDAKAAYLAYVQYTTRRFADVGMLPLSDLCNTDHAETLNVAPAYGDKEMNVFCLKALKPIRKGDELLVDYGQHDSEVSMFSLYGFALPPREEKGPSSSTRSRQETVKDCTSLKQSPDFIRALEDPSKDPILHNYWRFANMHC